MRKSEGFTAKRRWDQSEVAAIARSVDRKRREWIAKGSYYSPEQRTLWGRGAGNTERARKDSWPESGRRREKALRESYAPVGAIYTLRPPTIDQGANVPPWRSWGNSRLSAAFQPELPSEISLLGGVDRTVPGRGPVPGSHRVISLRRFLRSGWGENSFNSNRNYAEAGVLKKWEEGETTIPPPLSFLPALNQKKRRSSTLLLKSFRLQPRLSFVILIRLVVLRVRDRTLNRAP